MQSQSTMLQDLFDLYKKQLQEEIEQLSIFDDEQEYLYRIRHINKMVEMLSNMIRIRTDLHIDSSSYEPFPISSQPVIPDISEKEDEVVSYVFERKLRGGVVHFPQEEYFIPEQMVRHMGVVHGDELSIVREYEHHNKKRYVFRISNRIGKDMESRIQMNHFVVVPCPDKQSLCLYKDIDGKVHPNTSSHLYYISSNDIDNYSLKPGDIVDAAYYVNNPEGISIIFRHKEELKKPIDAFIPPKNKNTSIQNILFCEGKFFSHSQKDYDAVEKESRKLFDFLEQNLTDYQYTSVYGTEIKQNLLSSAKTHDLLIVHHLVTTLPTSSVLMDAFKKQGKPVFIYNPENLNYKENLLELMNGAVT